VFGNCIALATTEASCSQRNAECAAPQQCTWDGTAYACAPPAYTIELRRGVAFEDPCDLPITEVSSGMTLQIFGREFSVDNSQLSGPRLIDPRRTPSILPHGEDLTARLGSCARITGVAPNRRFLTGGGMWAVGDVIPSTGGPNNAVTIFYEGSNVVEFVYAGRPVGFDRAEQVPRWATPSIAWTNEGAVYRVVGPFLELSAGLAIRFTPRTL
jgi:hypothetical protein